MLKHLFEKRDQRFFKGARPEALMAAVATFWRSHQFSVDFQGPNAVGGAQFASRLGLRRTYAVRADPAADGYMVSLNFAADLTDEGAVVGVVGAIVLLPVTVAVGAVSYLEYENDANALIRLFWDYLNYYAATFGAQPVPLPPAIAPAALGAPLLCAKCGAPNESDSKFCKACGTALTRPPA